MNEVIKSNLSNSNASNTKSMMQNLQGLENMWLAQKQSQKQQLKKQISFLKEQVKRLKIDKLNQKILLSDERKGKINQKLQEQEDGNIFKVGRDDQSPRYVGSRLVSNSNNNQQQELQSPDHQYININHQAQLSQELSPHQKPHPASSTSNIVNFRVGRIVKNSQRYSLQKPTTIINNFSKTLEIYPNKNTPTSSQIIKQYNEPVIEQFNHSIHTRNDSSRKSNSVNHRNSQIHSQQYFRTLQSRSKLSNTSQQQPFHSRYQQRQKMSISQKINDDIIKTKLFHNKNPHVNTTKNISLISQQQKSKPTTANKKISNHLDFDQTVMSADITIRNHGDVEYFQQENLQTQKNVKQSDVKKRKQFVKSGNNFNSIYNNDSNTYTTYNHNNRNAHINTIAPLLSNNPSRTQTRKNSRVSLILTNPQYHQQQICETIKQKNISIRKVSYKIKNKKNPNDLRKAQLLNNFLELESGKKGMGSGVNRVGSGRSDGFDEGEENQKRSSVRKDGMNVNFQKQKEDILNKKSQKVRLLQKSKQKNASIEAEKFRQLKGKIIKNFATIEIPYEQSSQEQDQFAPDLLPTNTFSTTQIPFIGDKPDSKSNQQQIIQMTLRSCKKLNILSIKRDSLQNIVIKKFRNCLIFTIPDINKKVIWYYEGKLYIGECSSSPQSTQPTNQGHKSGQGIQIFSQKSYYYNGQFLNNKKHGSGIYINLIKNQIYQGQFLNGEKHGIGKLLIKDNGTLYEGQFKQNKYDGFGVLKLSKQNDRDQVYKGTFLRGLKHGYGIEVFKNGDKYKGQYQNGKFNGKGKYTWQNGNFYEGTFVKGMRTGQGKWMSSKQNGDSYVGIYLNDKKNGLGRYCWNNGSTFQGHFENDQKHGQGILTYENGKVVEGRWQHNKLVEIKNQSKQQRQKRQSEQQQQKSHQIYKSQDCQKVFLIDHPQKSFIQSSKLLKNA